ncbi:MAG TPA: Gfo/Idh/MocA family oxidoreductase [Polyangia bacterium]|nr:Gfo/Idh/MocA family oxidoreductase [Polyangia bacterium]
MNPLTDKVATVAPVRWGVLGASRFALRAAIPAMRQAPLAELRALASRTPDKAAEAARAAGAPRAYGRYEDLLADPEIEAVYNPLPNHLHVPWSIQAARAGKHVLCEKPIALSAAEAEALAAVQRETGVIIAEAFMIRYHPQWDTVAALIGSGRIGAVRALQIAFSYTNVDPTNIRNQREAGGGAVYDIGCYAINVARLIFAAEPRQVAAIAERDPGNGCDRLTSAILDFQGGQATFTIGTQHVRFQGVHVFGTDGHIAVEIPFNAPPDRRCKVFVDDGFQSTPVFTIKETAAERAEVLEVPVASQYALQWQAFSAAVRGGPPVRNDMRSAVANMRVIDAVLRAAESRQWEAV